MKTTKSNIREEVTARRALVTPDAHKRAQEALVEVLAPHLEGATCVLVYSALPVEASLASVVERLWERGRTVVFPRVAEERELSLHEVSDSSQLTCGAFSIQEPDEAKTKRMNPEEIDVAIIPGVAFTNEGDRLGYGGGYYDTLLPKLRDTCKIIGVAFDFQIYKQLPTEPHDQRVDYVVSLSV